MCEIWTAHLMYDHSRLWRTENQTTQMDPLWCGWGEDSDIWVNYNYLWIIYTGHIKPTPSLHPGRNQIQKTSVTDGIHTGGYFWPSISVLNFVWLQDWPDFSDILEATGITSAFIGQKIKQQVQLLYGSFGSQTKRDGQKENVTDGTVWIRCNFMASDEAKNVFLEVSLNNYSFLQ